MLNDKQIRKLRPVTPWEDSLVQPASLDVRLGAKAKVPIPLAALTVGVDVPKYRNQLLPFWLPPGKFILCHTLERLALPADIAGRFEGKSSLGRLGLMTHVTAGFIDPGFVGNLTLEVKNVGPHTLILIEGIQIGQLTFFTVEEVEHPYGSASLGSRYQNSEGAVGYRL